MLIGNSLHDLVIDCLCLSILSRLRALGWGPELAYLKQNGYAALLEHKQVKVPKKLTDRGM